MTVKMQRRRLSVLASAGSGVALIVGAMTVLSGSASAATCVTYDQDGNRVYYDCGPDDPNYPGRPSSSECQTPSPSAPSSASPRAPGAPAAPTVALTDTSRPSPIHVQVTMPYANCSDVTNYTVRQEPGGAIMTDSTGTFDFTGSAQQTYRVYATATNSAGTSAESAASNAVTEPASPPLPRSGPAKLVSVSTRSLTVGQSVTIKGLGTTGQNLALEISSPDYQTVSYSNRTAGSTSGATWTFSPIRNAHYRLVEAYGNSGTPSFDVTVRLSVSRVATRTSIRHWTFSGIVRPARSGRIVAVYQVSSTGSLTRLGVCKTASTGHYSLPHTFPSNGTRTFVVKASGDTLNAGGTSSKITYAIN